MEKEDSDIFVPKQYSFGFTLNYANPISWIIIVTSIAIIVISMTL